MLKQATFVMCALATGAGLSVLEAKKAEPTDVSVLTVESLEPIYLTTATDMERTHWSCHESFGEQGRQGIVVGCVNGSAQYEQLPLVDDHAQ